jgi:hypothetical protein
VAVNGGVSVRGGVCVGIDILGIRIAGRIAKMNRGCRGERSSRLGATGAIRLLTVADFLEQQQHTC